MDSAEFVHRLITTATDFVGLVETKQNTEWDDPLTREREAQKSVLLRSAMHTFGWDEGEPYCAAFLGAVVSLTAARLGRSCAPFRRIWTPHCMTNARKFASLKMLDEQPSDGALMLMQHGTTDRGHAALVAHVGGKAPDRILSTIEGNTMSGTAGDQRQGDGIYCRARNVFTNGNLKTQGWVSAKSLLTLLRVP